jgi:hypothetical protein
VEETARKLYYNESDQYEFREQLISRLEAIDLAGLSKREKTRLNIIIGETKLIDCTNRRPIIGKYSWKINQDADFFRAMAGTCKSDFKASG